MSHSRIASFCLLLSTLGAAAAPAQTREAVRTKYEEPAYPTILGQDEQQQGNVLLIGRITAQGKVADLHSVSATHQELVGPTIQAVKAWEFRPALRDGKPIEIFLNVGVRYRVKGQDRGKIPGPILGDLAISPADASGKKTAPEGFPIRRGKDPALRADVLLDLPPSKEARTLKVEVEALSQKARRRIPVFQAPVAVKAEAAEVKFPVVLPIGVDWDEGVWILRITVNGQNAGGGQFWVADDPSTFHFVVPTQ